MTQLPIKVIRILQSLQLKTAESKTQLPVFQHTTACGYWSLTASDPLSSCNRSRLFLTAVLTRLEMFPDVPW